MKAPRAKLLVLAHEASSFTAVAITRCSKASPCHFCSILALLAADAEGGRAAVDAVEAKDVMYSETASVASIQGKSRLRV